MPCPTLPQATLQQEDTAREFNHGSVKPSLLEAVSLLLFIFLMDLSRSAAGAGFLHQHPSCCASPPANWSMKRPSSFNYRRCYSPITVFLPFYSSFCPPSHKGRTEIYLIMNVWWQRVNDKAALTVRPTGERTAVRVRALPGADRASAAARTVQGRESVAFHR